MTNRRLLAFATVAAGLTLAVVVWAVVQDLDRVLAEYAAAAHE